MSLSVYGLVATMVESDEIWRMGGIDDEEGFGLKPLLKNILRACHQMDHQRFDATQLAEVIVVLIADWQAGGVFRPFAEDEGSGFSGWRDYGYTTIDDDDATEPALSTAPSEHQEPEE